LQRIRKIGPLAAAQAARRLTDRERRRHCRRRRSRPRKDGSVIVRVLTAHVRAARVGQFNAAMRRQLPLMRDQPGLVYLKLARRLEADGGEEVVLFEEWRDPDSVYAWVGNDLSKPRLLKAAIDAAEHVVATHYEALDIGIDEVDPAGPGEVVSAPDRAGGPGDLSQAAGPGDLSQAAGPA
jgi:heme-degrading monooxygenase HmoA